MDENEVAGVSAPEAGWGREMVLEADEELPLADVEGEAEEEDEEDPAMRRSAGSRFASLLRLGDVGCSSSSSASRVLTYSAQDFCTSDRVRGWRSSRWAARASKQ